MERRRFIGDGGRLGNSNGEFTEMLPETMRTKMSISYPGKMEYPKRGENNKITKNRRRTI